MAATVQAKSTTALGEKTTITVSKPTGTVDDDLLITAIYYEDRTISTSPSGWILLQNSAFANSGLAVYYKIASSEGASWDWVLDSNANAGAICLRIDGYAPSLKISTSAVGTSVDDPTPTLVNSVTPTYANALLVFFVGVGDITTSGVSAYAIATDNPSWTEQADLSGGGLDTLAVATANRTQTTATGNSSCTIGDGSTENLADTNGIMIVVESRQDVTVNAGAISLTGTPKAVSVAADANVSLGVIGLTSAAKTPTVTITPSKVTNLAKSADATITNVDKS